MTDEQTEPATESAETEPAVPATMPKSVQLDLVPNHPDANRLRDMSAELGWANAKVYESPVPGQLSRWILHDGGSRAVSVGKEAVAEVRQAIDVQVFRSMVVALHQEANEFTGPGTGREVEVGHDPIEYKPAPIKIEDCSFTPGDGSGPDDPTVDLDVDGHMTDQEKIQTVELGRKAAADKEPRTSPCYVRQKQTDAWYRGFDNEQARQFGAEKEIGQPTIEPPILTDEALTDWCCGAVDKLRAYMADRPAFGQARQYLQEARNVCPGAQKVPVLDEHQTA